MTRPGYFQPGSADPYVFLLSEEQLADVALEAVPEVKAVSPRLSMTGLISHDEVTIGFSGEAVDPEKDADLGIGQLMATTVMSNTRYLFSKVCSNFLLLSTIAVIAIGMSLVLTILYSDDSTIALHTFILPYLMITIPSLFCVAVLSVLFEILFYEQRIVQYILFFALFF